MTEGKVKGAGTAEPLSNSAKFRNPLLTADGKERAWVSLKKLRTLWFNTGTLCNLTCRNCYIESSPRNDRLAYLSATEVASYLDEIESECVDTEEIGFTGGEPFMNPEILPMLEESLHRGFRVLVLTNAMRPMMKVKTPLLLLNSRFPRQLFIRVSLDHYDRAWHEGERGERSWAPTLAGLAWLCRNRFAARVAGRRFSGEPDAELRAGYARLFRAHDLQIDAFDNDQLVLFPEMEAAHDVTEITTACWGILGVSPDTVMCASSRMVIKRNGAAHPTVVSCTLLPYDREFELGRSLRAASGPVRLNHPYCAQFCVLGSGSCSGKR
ncbi:MAG: radical SAM protein [Alphaproteobacteria bacterium]